jgi:hypothetical protein
MIRMGKFGASAMRIVFAFLAMMSLNATAAIADDCKPLKLLNKIQMIPDTDGNWGIPVTVNGQEKMMALGLGSSSSFVNRKAVTELSLPTRKGDLIVKDLDGNVSNDIARVRELKFGYVLANDHWFIVDPNPTAGQGGEIGRISRDMLFGYDVDIDFGTGILSLFAQEHCPDRVGYWVEPPPSTDIIFKDLQVSFPVSLDGRDFSAVLVLTDHSEMTQEVAERVFGLTPSPDDLVPVPRSTSSPPIKGYYHTFSSVSFGGVTVKNLRVLIVQDTINKNNQPSGNHASSFELSKFPHLVIGLNVLKYLHINITPRTGKLFVSAASTPAAK